MSKALTRTSSEVVSLDIGKALDEAFERAKPKKKKLKKSKKKKVLAIARRVARGASDSGIATSIFLGEVLDTTDDPLKINAQVSGPLTMTWSMSVFGKAVL